MRRTNTLYASLRNLSALVPMGLLFLLGPAGQLQAQCTVIPPAGVDVTSPAYAQVITEDTFCCTDDWDMFCQQAYDALVGGGGGCVVVPPVGVDVTSPAYAQVIAEDAFCCNEGWDELCQDAYDALTGGGGGCTVVPPVGVDVTSPAYIEVVTLDPFCCNTAWDADCQAAYDILSGGGGPPANDDCANSTPVGDGETPFTTVGATGVIEASCAEGDFNDIWYTYTATCTGTATIQTCGSLFDTVLSAYDACGGNEIECNDDFCGLQSQLEFEVTEGNSYLIRISGYDGDTGTGVLTISCGVPPPCLAVTPPGVDVTSPAYAQVIADDPFCCTDTWDGLCQQAYDDLTGGGTGYCDAGADGTGLGLDERIINVTVADIDNDSPNLAPVAPAYQDFTSVVGTVEVGGSYPISIGVSSSIGTTFNTNQVLVWIDLNGDEDFDDAGELVFVSDIGAVPAYTGTITIPAGTPVGTTRMRIRLHDTYVGVDYVNNLNDTPCGLASYGEVEDYTLVIEEAGGGCAVVPPAGVDVTSLAYAAVIATNPACCDVAWDGLCQQAYDDLTGGGTGYCDAGADGTGLGLDERIINVTVADIDNDSPNLAPVAPAYQDFTSVVGTVLVGETYPISIGVSSSIGTTFNTNQVLVWIDLNGDEDFDDAGELVFVSDIGAVSEYTGNITIPAGTPAGTTRMRVRLHDTYVGVDYVNNLNDTPCGIASYGEVEDYTLVIDLSTSAQEVADVAWNVFPNPNNGDFTIRAQNVNGPVMLEVFDMAARLVHTARPVVTAGEDVQVALRGGVAPGTYLLRMTTDDGRYEQRIVVQ